MKMPLGHRVTDEDRHMASEDLSIALEMKTRNWFSPSNAAALMGLMTRFNIFPNREPYPECEHVTVHYGPHSEDMRVVQVEEFEDRHCAVVFAIVLAITTKINEGLV